MIAFHLVLLSALAACSGESSPAGVSEAQVQGAPGGAYSFFVAGHTYGKPGGDTHGLHPPMKARLPWILERPGMSFGVLLGDVVRRPNGRHWDSAASDIEQIGIPVHLAVGNHDIAYEGAEGRPDLVFRSDYHERFGPTYYAFRHAEDLFLVLDTTLDHWNFSGPQLELLERELAGPPFRNLFVFMHHLVWWRHADEPGLRPNSLDGRSKGEPPNFWREIAPRLRATHKPVYVIAGDLGAHKKATSFDYRRVGPLHLVGSGMGEGIKDNCLVVQVDADGAVELRLVALQGDPDSLGPLR